MKRLYGWMTFLDIAREVFGFRTIVDTYPHIGDLLARESVSKMLLRAVVLGLVEVENRLVENGQRRWRLADGQTWESVRTLVALATMRGD